MPRQIALLGIFNVSLHLLQEPELVIVVILYPELVLLLQIIIAIVNTTCSLVEEKMLKASGLMYEVTRYIKQQLARLLGIFNIAFQPLQKPELVIIVLLYPELVLLAPMIIAVIDARHSLVRDKMQKELENIMAGETLTSNVPCPSHDVHITSSSLSFLGSHDSSPSSSKDNFPNPNENNAAEKVMEATVETVPSHSREELIQDPSLVVKTARSSRYKRPVPRIYHAKTLEELEEKTTQKAPYVSYDPELYKTDLTLSAILAEPS
ncbi:hypothetical protein VNI00_016146 [Paramarasmius palmivorus]|uniref:Uncharacterized protein n=1 Tax=Paramarasmius palmivorus TaxID=297713 RepID=A0AAW0BEN9_9AGAR